MKDILKGLNKGERKLWLNRLRRKLEFRRRYAICKDQSFTIELDSEVIETLNRFCSTFEINMTDFLNTLICDFLLRGEVQSPITDMVDLLDLTEYVDPQHGEGH